MAEDNKRPAFASVLTPEHGAYDYLSGKLIITSASTATRQRRRVRRALAQAEDYDMTTHETYFHRYNLSVEQYGEILAAEAFHGTKMPKGNPGFDVEVKATDSGRMMRIEVKSKFATTDTGKATVIHCCDRKFADDAMTHLLVILIDPDETRPSVRVAWLITNELPSKLRRTATQSKYINVGDVRRLSGKRDVTAELQAAAETRV